MVWAISFRPRNRVPRCAAVAPSFRVLNIVDGSLSPLLTSLPESFHYNPGPAPVTLGCPVSKKTRTEKKNKSKVKIQKKKQGLHRARGDRGWSPRAEKHHHYTATKSGEASIQAPCRLAHLTCEKKQNLMGT